MQPFLVTPDIIDSYLDAGHWSRETMLDRYRAFAKEYPDKIACSDGTEAFSWAELDAASDLVAANLIDLGLPRDATALIQISSTCREIVLRVALKKAGIIGVFTPLQWRRMELAYVWERINPGLVVISSEQSAKDSRVWLDDAIAKTSERCHRIDIGHTPLATWTGWQDMLETPPSDIAVRQIADRAFRFDEISLITASSGTSGLAKLCEWPEGAQVCQSRVLRERMEIAGDDKIGIFAPTSGAAGLMMWMVSWTVPCCCIFPDDYKAPTLLDLVEQARITVGTTVPVILVRLAQEPLEPRDLQSLRLMRVGTAAAEMSAARAFENRSGCRIVIASGSMECTGFGHAHVNEPKDLRLDGSVGLPLHGGQLRIEDDQGIVLPAGTAGELKVSAPFASSGYWKDPEATAAAWSNGWYATGDVGVLDDDGRLRLLGRLKETINRSGHKILPADIEQEIALLPEIIECAVVAAPDREYGQVPWAFVQMRTGCALDPASLINALKESGFASYKIPARFIEIAQFPRINDSKVDKKALLRMASPAPTSNETG
jgi:non-ribosomal peptide synthetase component E (peptide arylation enzyme)